MFKDDLKNGKVKYGTFSRSVELSNAEILTECGFDFIVFDMQHGLFKDTDIRNLINVTLLRGGNPVIRVPGPREEYIIHALDFGATGIIIPGCETIEEARRAASYTKFYPIANRGLNGASPEALHGLKSVKDYMEDSNKKVLTLMMVESNYMVEHLDELLDIESVDGIFIGPNDLSVSLGIPGDTNNKIEVDIIEDVIKRTHEKGKIAGIYNSNTEIAKRNMAFGANFISISNDFKFLQTSIKNCLKEMK